MAAAIDAGQLASDEPTRMATLLWSGLHGLVHLQLQGLLPPDDAEDRLEWTMKQLIGGLASGFPDQPTADG